MNKHPAVMALLSTLLLLPTLTLHAVVLLDPALTTGSNAIDPPGDQTVDQTASGAVSQLTLETLPEFAAIQSVISSWSPQGTPNYIVFTDATRPHVKSTYGGLTGSSPGGQMHVAELRTSPGISMGVDSGSGTAGVIVFDFGKATFSGTTVSSFDSGATAPTAAGFTVCGLDRVTSNVTIQYFGTDDTTVLSTQVLLKAPDPNVADGATYGSDGYTGFQATGAGTASGIGKIVVTGNTIMSGNYGIAIDDFAYNSSGKVYYMTVSGTGLMDGRSWAHSLPKSSIVSVLHTHMNAGDTLLLGSGTYGDLNLDLTTSGAAGRPKSITGVNTGGNFPVLNSNWSPSSPASGEYLISMSPGVSHWTISNLVIRNYRHAVHSGTTSSPNKREGLTFRNLDIRNVRHGFYLSECKTLTIEECSVKNYTKHAYRLERRCEGATFRNCTADLSDGDPSWYDKSEADPVGFLLNGEVSGTNKIISFYDCVAKHNRRNNQTDTYWNGDGFLANGNNEGISFDGCISIENEDAGFDIKPAASYKDCVAVRNYHGFKVWYGNHVMVNCVSTFPVSRRPPNNNGLPTVSENGTYIHVPEISGNATVQANYFTGHGKASKALFENHVGTISATNSIISLTGTTTVFTHGSVTLINTGTYRAAFGSTPAVGTNPNFVNPSPSWNGLGNAMDSQTYNLTRGYNSTR